MSIGQLLVSVLFLLNQAKRNKGSLLLVLVLLVFCFNIIEPVFIWTRFLFTVPHLLYIGPFFLLLLGPALYLHMMSIKSKAFKWKPIHTLHLLPFLFSKFWMFPNFFQSATTKRNIIQSFYESEALSSSSFDLASFLFQMHPILYFLVTISIVLVHKKTNENSRFSKFHVLYFGGLSFVISFYLFASKSNLFSLEIYWKILAILMFTFVCFLSYSISKGLLKPRNPVKPATQDDKAKSIYTEIKEVMDREQLYLNPTFSLTSFANRLEITPKFLSKIIHEFEHKNFPEFINSYRVKAAKCLIVDPKLHHYTLEAIAKEAGFSNKMSFNRAFKKHLNMTPSAYKTAMK